MKEIERPYSIIYGKSNHLIVRDEHGLGGRFPPKNREPPVGSMDPPEKWITGPMWFSGGFMESVPLVKDGDGELETVR